MKKGEPFIKKRPLTISTCKVGGATSPYNYFSLSSYQLPDRLPSLHIVKYLIHDTMADDDCETKISKGAPHCIKICQKTSNREN